MAEVCRVWSTPGVTFVWDSRRHDVCPACGTCTRSATVDWRLRAVWAWRRLRRRVWRWLAKVKEVRRG